METLLHSIDDGTNTHTAWEIEVELAVAVAAEELTMEAVTEVILCSKWQNDDDDDDSAQTHLFILDSVR